VNQVAVLAQNKYLIMKQWNGTGVSAGKTVSVLANSNNAVYIPGSF
jgi:hypothetical protein